MMRIVACVKQVHSIPGQIKFLSDGSGIDPYFLESGMNDPDRYAVEEAMRIRDESSDSQVIALTLGESDSEAALREALSMGVDRAVRVSGNAVTPDPMRIGGCLADAITDLEADVVIAGVQSTDDAQQVTGAVIAAVLGWPCIVGVLAVVIRDGRIEAHRESSDGRMEVVDTELPAVLVVQTGINSPRYGTFKDKLKAKKADIEISGISTDSRREYVRLMRVYEDSPSTQNIVLLGDDPDEVAEKIIDLMQEIQR